MLGMYTCVMIGLLRPCLSCSVRSFPDLNFQIYIADIPERGRWATPARFTQLIARCWALRTSLRTIVPGALLAPEDP